MTLSRLAIFFVLAVGCVCSTSRAQQPYLEWNPLSDPVYQEPDYDFVKDPSIFEDENGLYHMYYTGSAAGFQGGSPFPWRIDHATSPDGLNWTKAGTSFAAENNTWESGRVQAPSKPVWYDGQYYMFYAGGPRNPENIVYIGYATSTDLVNWEKADDYVVSQVNNGVDKANDPFIYQEDDLFYMFYTTYPPGQNESIFYRTSTNLEDWSSPVGSGAWGEGAAVWKQQDTYYMLGAIGSSSVGETYSLFSGPSLSSFELVGELDMDIPAFADDSWGHGDIIVRGNTVDLYFQGTSDRGSTFQIGWASPVFTGLSRSDLNGDGVVDLQDFSIFSQYNNADLSGLSANEAASKGDLDGDGDNDYADFKLFQSDFDAAVNSLTLTSEGTAVPEPSSSILILLGVASVLSRRTHRAVGCRYTHNRRLSASGRICPA